MTRTLRQESGATDQWSGIGISGRIECLSETRRLPGGGFRHWRRKGAGKGGDATLNFTNAGGDAADFIVHIILVSGGTLAIRKAGSRDLVHRALLKALG